MKGGCGLESEITTQFVAKCTWMKSGSKTGKDPGEDGTRRWYQQVQTAGGKECQGQYWGCGVWRVGKVYKFHSRLESTVIQIYAPTSNAEEAEFNESMKTYKTF